jgi:hypothetical protein
MNPHAEEMQLEKTTSSACAPIAAAIRSTLRRNPELVPKWCDAADMRERPHEPFRGQGPMMVLVRDPRKRLVSAFENHLHSFGIAKGGYQLMSNAVDAALAANVSGNGQLKALEVFANWPGIQGCTVKMLTGSSCANDPNKLKPTRHAHKIADTSSSSAASTFFSSTPSNSSSSQAVLSAWASRVALATEILLDRSRTVFFGITDLYNASVCLFHAMLGGTVDPLELGNVHPTTAASQTRSLDQLQRLPAASAQNPARNPYDFKGFRVEDPVDQLLFDAALEEFNHRLLEYHDFVAPCCAQHGCSGYYNDVAMEANQKSP